MTPQIITTLVIIVAMFALMLLNKFPLAVTMTLTGVALARANRESPRLVYYRLFSVIFYTHTFDSGSLLRYNGCRISKEERRMKPNYC